MHRVEEKEKKESRGKRKCVEGREKKEAEG